MIVTIDKAGRMVIPKRIREAMGVEPGMPLVIDYVDGKIEIEYAPVESEVLIAEDGLPLIVSKPAPGTPPLTDEMLREGLEAVRDEGVADYL
ncbi:MAG: AbrB/MazE/SpoVT family DNA-binding domain-containing protein [Leucobacter sp.]|jgi:AbrB family looped-hinge helix DNA binding protein|nr:AbrB/MazE/SpoVT family DNA-binding domain-containing protein [Leucobacter sp.]